MESNQNVQKRFGLNLSAMVTQVICRGNYSKVPPHSEWPQQQQIIPITYFSYVQPQRNRSLTEKDILMDTTFSSLKQKVK